jgi:EAL domain-containing protein (putative c-di-GMP-specific phosphodiesterase class I)
MLEHAVHLARAGREVSVNITGQTIGDSEAMNKVQASLGTAGRAVAGKIIFEITETMALTSPETARTFCRDMRSLGCRVALDDFGTGYGGLTEIRSLDLDVLKIDRSFVQNMLDEGRDERAVKIVVFAAREYGLTTVAEGVEQDAVLAKLAEMGADRAQGFLFSRPRPVAV